jgi:CRP/FNR family transcriptional regulator, anaerobic regulatory protein
MNFIDQVPEFEFSAKLKQQLQEYGVVKHFAEGEVVLSEGAYIKAVPIVQKGSIRVMRTDESGREILLYYVDAGESCVMSFLGGLQNDDCKLKVIAEKETELLMVPVDKIQLLINEYPEWLSYIFRLYHQRFEELLNVINSVTFKKMDERMLTFIQKKCEHAHSKTITITHEQLANELGTVRVVVSRLLKQMEIENLVVLGRNKITLL